MELSDNTLQIQLAGKTILIQHNYNEIDLMCRAYIYEARSCDIRLEVTSDEVLCEREKIMQEDNVMLSPEYVETIVAYRKIAEAMPSFNAFLMHGAVVATGDSAVMVTAKSGEGKTTFVNTWLKSIEGSYVVNGDKPLIYVEDAVYACGTPWSGKEKMNRNCAVPLKAVCILERGNKDEIHEISAGEAFPYLFQQTYRNSADAEHMKKTLELLKAVMTMTRIYKLKFKYHDYEADISCDAACMAFRHIYGSADKRVEQ